MILILLKLINLKIINSIHNSSIYVSSESCEQISGSCGKFKIQQNSQAPSHLNQNVVEVNTAGFLNLNNRMYQLTVSMLIDIRLIFAMNNQNKCILSSPESKKRWRYQILSPADKAEVGRYATQHSTPQTVAHFKDTVECQMARVCHRLLES